MGICVCEVNKTMNERSVVIFHRIRRYRVAFKSLAFSNSRGSHKSQKKNPVNHHTNVGIVVTKNSFAWMSRARKTPSDAVKPQAFRQLRQAVC